MEVMNILFFTSLVNFWTIFLKLVGFGGLRLRLRKLNSSPLSVTSAKWNRAPAGPLIQLTACSHFATSLVCTLGAICTKLISGWVFDSLKSSYDCSYWLFSGFPVDNTCGEGSVGVASQLYPVSKRRCN